MLKHPSSLGLVLAFGVGALFQRWLSNREETRDATGDTADLQSELLIAVSAASPAPVPDVPVALFDLKNRFTIVVEGNPSSAELAEDESDRALLWWDSNRSSAESGALSSQPSASLPSAAEAPPVHQSTSPPVDAGGSVVSETILSQESGDPRGPGARTKPSDGRTSENDASGSVAADQRFVSVTDLNELMGPPAPDEDDDDEGFWLWGGEGFLAWLATAATGLVAGAGSGTAFGAGVETPDSDSQSSGLDIGFTAGPFLDGEITLEAFDEEGNLLFEYDANAPGTSLTDGVTLTSVSTETVGDDVVITGLDVEFDNFAGDVFLQIGSGKYIDEALNGEVSLDIPLRALAEVPAEGVGVVNITPFTELAIRIIEAGRKQSVDFDGADPDVLRETSGFLDSASERVRDLTGVDIRDTAPVAVNQASFADFAKTPSSQYGLKLAALSQFGNDLKQDSDDSNVKGALEALLKDIEASANENDQQIIFQNPGRALTNQLALTDSQDTFIEEKNDVTDQVIDAVRPESSTTPGPLSFAVIDGVPQITGEALLREIDPGSEDVVDLSLRIALGDNVVFTEEEVQGPGSGDLEITDKGNLGEDGRFTNASWSLSIEDLDAGTYTLDVFVVDGFANVSRVESEVEDFAPSLVLMNGVDTFVLTEGDDAADIAADGRIATFDLNVTDTVSGELSVSSDKNPLGFSERELLGFMDIPTGQILDNASSLGFSDWAFSGDAEVFDALGAGDTFSATYTLRVADSTGKSDEVAIEVTINGTNDAAIISGATSASGDETDQPLTLTGTLTSEDVDGVDDAFIPAVVSGDIGTLEISASGDWTFEAAEAFDELALGESRQEAFTVKAADDTPQDIVITINGTNDAAIISGATSASGDETDQSLTLTGTLTSEDVDGVDGAFIPAVVSGDIGALDISASGDWTFEAAEAFDELALGESRQEAFTVKAADDTPQDIVITINGTNDAAIISGATSASGDETDQPLTLSGTLISQDVDGVDDAFVPAVVSGDIGTLELSASGDWTFEAAAAFNNLAFGENQQETFTVKAADDTPQDIVITINGTNDAPQNTITAASGEQGTPIELTGLSVEDVDETGELTVVLTVEDGEITIRDDITDGLETSDIASNGSRSVILSGTQAQINATLSGTDAVVYENSPDFSGTDTLKMVTIDSLGLETGTEADITVLPDESPTATITPAQRIVQVGDLTRVDIVFSVPVSAYSRGSVEFDSDIFDLGIFVPATPATDQKFALSGKSLATSQFTEVSLAAGASSDEAGNESLASNTERLIVLGEDAIVGNIRDEVFDEEWPRSDPAIASLPEAEQAEYPVRTPADGEFIFGDAGDDVIFGYGGDDVLMGGADDDALLGGEGDDTFLAGPGDDYMAGGAGDDVYLIDEFEPNAGSENIFIGNGGNDVVEFRGSSSDYLINRVTQEGLNRLNDALQDEKGQFRGRDMPELQLDQALPVWRIDRVTEDGRQTDFIQAETFQFADARLIYAQSSSNSEYFLTANQSDAGFVHNGGGRPIQETGSNLVRGQGGDDRFIGGDGDDDLQGGAGSDILVSVGGEDRLAGGTGDDTLIALGTGAGKAVLEGGEDRDTFVVAPESGTPVDVRILDFDAEEDLINLDGLYASDAGDGVDPSALIEAISELDADGGVAEIELDGFFVVNRSQDDDAQTDDGYSPVSGKIEVTFSAGSIPSNFEGLFTEQNPVASSDWWNDLIDAGGLS